MSCSNCGREKVHAKGFCGSCYSRYLQKGNPAKTKKKKITECLNCGKFGNIKAKGFCGKCYQRLIRYGDPKIINTKVKKKRKCPFCGKEDYLVKNLCHACYYRQKNTGTVEYTKVRRKCIIETCNSLSVCKGFCDKHYKRFLRHVQKDKRFIKRDRNISKKSTLRKRFNLSFEDFNRLFEKQNGVCAICGQKEAIINKNTKEPISLSVDHCHNTKQIRGLLCSRCNTALGSFNDSTELLKKAIHYLEK